MRGRIELCAARDNGRNAQWLYSPFHGGNYVPMTSGKLTIAIAAALLAAYPSVAVAGKVSKGQPPVPASNPGTWVSTKDYPPSALRVDAQGTTGFTLEIDAEGVPTGCKVTRSSGYDDLDSTTCAVMQERARFKPATDARGHAARGTWSSRVRWQTPENPELAIPQSRNLVFEYTIEKDGTISGCRVVNVENTPLDPCRGLSPGGFVPATDDHGNPVRKVVTQQFTTTVADAPQ